MYSCSDSIDKYTPTGILQQFVTPHQHLYDLYKNNDAKNIGAAGGRHLMKI
jgi:hypothetical protein